MTHRTALRLVVRGQVQGVGFRPFVYRLAVRCRLGGSVCNSSAGVVVEVEGPPEDVALFIKRLMFEIPTAARIDGLNAEQIAVADRASFAIAPNAESTSPGVRLPRDLATCADCREDLFAAKNRRCGYPFTNCTACGPRYSIIEAMPYDRAATTMGCFAMCSTCDTEYHTPEDRRFHAEPNGCSACGPQVALWDPEGRTIAGPEAAIRAAAGFLRNGRILAVKGLGGFQLLVRADDAEAVRRLRQLKGRPSKPLAVMLDRDAAQRLTDLAPLERRLLTSSANPIVLVERDERLSVAPEVAPRAGTIGIILPTTPLHHLLLADLGPIVVTSGNSSGEPILTDERLVLRCLAGIADAFLIHDRPIVRGVDDSVSRVIAGQEVVFRLGRGHAPLALPVLESLGRGAPPMLATGGHQKVALALWTGEQAILGQHLGDMDHPDARHGFENAVRDLCQLYRCEPAAIACDEHPDYFTTRWADAANLPIIRVQHHHAHAMACMAEHSLLDREVLALAWDGTGHGRDGTTWGGEILRVNPAGFTRIGSLRPFPLPGGEAAIRHPNRAAFGLLWALLGDGLLNEKRLLHRLGIGERDAALLATMLRKGINSPFTSSVGRLFDAVAALTLGVRGVSYEGEAAVWLESVADPAVSEGYPLPAVGDWRPMLTDLLDDLSHDKPAGRIAARFHNGLANWALAVARDHPLADVVLGGGCFQNRVLAERTIAGLRSVGRRVHLPGLVPPGDGGLAVGQLAVALLQSQRR